jgi:glycosyltransferase involved in cell wall biosynthesis
VNYYNTVAPHLEAKVRFVDIGRPHIFYGGGMAGLLQWTPFRLLTEWISILFSILRFNPDILHINPSLDTDTQCKSLKRDAVNALIGLLCRRQVLIFWRGWDGNHTDAPEFPGGNNGWMARIYFRASAQIVLAKRFKVSLQRWGVSSPVYVETTVASECMFNAVGERGWQQGPIELLFLSRMEDAKGVFQLVEAYRRLKERNDRYRLVFAGDGPAKEALEAYVRDMNLRDVVFRGFVAGDAKLDCYRTASIFCFPSSYPEGMPNAVLEAMGAGLPIVGSDVGGLQDFLEEGVTGAVLKVAECDQEHRFDPDRIADAIEKLAEDPEQCRRVSKFNQNFARNHFMAPVVAGRLQRIYESLASGDFDRSLDWKNG